jgi:Domain of unknown function (DUF4845)
MRRESERGGGKLKVLFVLLVVVGMFYSSFKIVPYYVNNFELQKGMTREARFSGVDQKSPQQIRDEILNQATQLGITASPDDIQVEPAPNGYRISLSYTVPVDLLGYQLLLKFHPTADGSSF